MLKEVILEKIFFLKKRGKKRKKKKAKVEQRLMLSGSLFHVQES